MAESEQRRHVFRLQFEGAGEALFRLIQLLRAEVDFADLHVRGNIVGRDLQFLAEFRQRVAIVFRRVCAAQDHPSQPVVRARKVRLHLDDLAILLGGVGEPVLGLEHLGKNLVHAIRSGRGVDQ